MARRRRPVLPAGAVLAPGAGAGSDHHALVFLDGVLQRHAIAVRRVDFPYRLAGRRAPDRPPVLVATVREAAQSLARDLGVEARRILLGGRSMGGRVCSLAASEGLECAGLLLVSYPLHPPGAPGKLRTAHFGGIHVPCLFVSGERDRFGAPQEFDAALAAIASPVTRVVLAGGDHGLRARDGEVGEALEAWLDGFAPGPAQD